MRAGEEGEEAAREHGARDVGARPLRSQVSPGAWGRAGTRVFVRAWAVGGREARREAGAGRGPSRPGCELPSSREGKLLLGEAVSSPGAVRGEAGGCGAQPAAAAARRPAGKKKGGEERRRDDRESPRSLRGAAAAERGIPRPEPPLHGESERARPRPAPLGRDDGREEASERCGGCAATGAGAPAAVPR